jgi:hypothetical protein
MGVRVDFRWMIFALGCMELDVGFCGLDVCM